MEKFFDPGKENRLFKGKGMKIELKNDGDNFRLHIIDSLLKNFNERNIRIQSVLDIGSGIQGSLGKGIANILQVPKSELYQIDLVGNKKFNVKTGNILITENLPNRKFDLGLLIQVVRDISNFEEVQNAIANLMKRSEYSVITNIDQSISRVNGELYCNFDWIDEDRGLAVISTKFFDGGIHHYKPFYIHDRQKIENFIKKNGNIIEAKPWIYNNQPIYHYWITKNR